MRCLLAFALFFCSSMARADPADAVVRMRSHGASGTVVWTDGQRSLILSCAHMFWERGGQRVSPALRDKPIAIDGMPGQQMPERMGRTKVLAIDSEADLSLIEVDIGLPHVAPIAMENRPGRRLRSVGYDEMAWPATNRPCTILRVEGDRFLTREKPWHGRSGGGLLDADTGELIGVVSGYEVGGPRWSIVGHVSDLSAPTSSGRGGWQEVGNGAGIYVSHEAILRFVGWSDAPRQQQWRGR